MTQTIDVFWSFRSPYSYLVLPQLKQLTDEFDVNVNVRPVYPLAVRDVSFFTNRRPQQIPYLAMDMVREAQRLGVPFRWPQPDPIIQDMDTMTVAKEQPLIDHLMLLGAVAQREQDVDAFPFFEGVSKLLFDGGTDNWHQGSHLADAAVKAGFDLDEMERTAQRDKEDLLKLIEENESDQQQHHWGVPLMVLNAEAFFGQDRISTLRWRLQHPAG